MAVFVSRTGWIATLALVISVLALVAYQFPAETSLARLRSWYPVGDAGDGNRNESLVGGFGGVSAPVDENTVVANSRKPRVAVCLVGGARAFELTGKTLLKYVLETYSGSAVFLHSPLDKDSHKFTLLRGASGLTNARIFVPRPLPESWVQREVLTGANSPNGIQGLLQYFNLVEGCLRMIREHENKHSIKYDWIVRTRVDGYWSGRPPTLGTFDPSFYYIPEGSHYGGLNDRLGIGTADTSRVALSRLSLLPFLHQHGGRNLNSETAFKAQLKFSKVPFKTERFPFCILTERKYAWPPAYFGVPVLALSTNGSMNGAKCRPCTPKSTGAEAIAISSKLGKGWGWPGLIDGLELCDARGGWEPQWHQIYERESGEQLSGDALNVTTRSIGECIRDVEELQKQWEIWDAPPAKEICSMKSPS